MNDTPEHPFSDDWWGQAGWEESLAAWPVDMLDVWLALGQPVARYCSAGIRLAPGMVPGSLWLMLN